jgi:hypothetical protein
VLKPAFSIDLALVIPKLEDTGLLALNSTLLHHGLLVFVNLNLLVIALAKSYLLISFLATWTVLILASSLP